LQAAKAIEHHAERQAAKAFELQASGEPSWPMSAVPSELPKPYLSRQAPRQGDREP
jgi:hypothetical protein